MEKWITKLSKDVLTLRIFKIKSHIRQSAKDSNKKGEFYSLQSKDWAVVVPVSYKDSKRVITLVRQYRHGSDDLSIEFPCGNIENGEKPVAGAERELIEESGLSFEKIIKIGDLSPNPAIMENTVHFFVAENCFVQSQQHLDEHEEIEVIEMDEKFLITDFMGKDKYAKNAMMMACLMFYVRYLKKEHNIDYFKD